MHLKRLGCPGPTTLASRRVHFALAPLRRLLVMSVLAQIGKDTGFLDLFFEALERALKVLFVVDDDFRQTRFPLGWPRSGLFGKPLV